MYSKYSPCMIHVNIIFSDKWEDFSTSQTIWTSLIPMIMIEGSCKHPRDDNKFQSSRLGRYLSSQACTGEVFPSIRSWENWFANSVLCSSIGSSTFQTVFSPPPHETLKPARRTIIIRFVAPIYFRRPPANVNANDAEFRCWCWSRRLALFLGCNLFYLASRATLMMAERVGQRQQHRCIYPRKSLATDGRQKINECLMPKQFHCSMGGRMESRRDKRVHE